MIKRQYHQTGFSLLELSIVLLVIGVIIGAVSIGKDVHRNAIYQRIGNDYIQAWAIAYDRYFDGTGHAPGDSASAPTGRVNASGTTTTSGTALCGADLLSAMQAAGIDMPSGRTTGTEERFAYLDSNGLPHELQVCFRNVLWSEPAAAPGEYVTRSRNVMTISGLTPALAGYLDATFDTRVDARFGKLREQAQANITTANAPSVDWSVDERMAFGETSATNRDESQVAEVSAFLKMTR